MEFSVILLLSSGAIPLVVANIIPRTVASTMLLPPAISPTPVLPPSPLSTPEPMLPSLTSSHFLSNTQVISVPQTTDPAKLSDLDLSIKTNAKWHLTTYYSCVTRGTYTNCGTFERVFPGGTEIAAATRLGGYRRGLAAGVVAGMAGGLMCC